MSTCQTCGAWKYNDRHACHPIFGVRWPEASDDWWEVRAMDAEEAAEKWAAEQDQESADYRIVGQHSTPTVEVRGPDGAITRWQVSGEAVATYYAKELSQSDIVRGPHDEQSGDNDESKDGYAR